jgi:hypothetical protein
MPGQLFVLCSLFVRHIGDGLRHGLAHGVVIVDRCVNAGRVIDGAVIGFVVRDHVVVAGRAG